MNPTVFMAGLSVGLGLIIAIGAQNAFVLRQGLRGDHVFWVCLTCALSDAVLILAGVTGFGALTTRLPWLDPVMRYGGCAFLIWYGFRSLRSAMGPRHALQAAQDGRQSLASALMTCLALTWLNPHVYLDTVVLLGSVSTQFPAAKADFAAGAMTGSFLFFFALGYGARLLRPLFANPKAWRVLDALIALVMWAIAFSLLGG